MCSITVEEQVEDYWSDEHGQGEMFEGPHCKVEPDVDTTATEAAFDRLLARCWREALDHQMGGILEETQQ